MVAIYPGSFDPVTFGHLDIIRRAAGFCDKLIVAVLNNSGKKPFFTLEERIEMLAEEVKGIENVEVDSFAGLLADYAKVKNARIIIRGLRAISDFEYEFQMALTNRMLDNGLETLFLSTSLEHLYLASGIVKEIAMFDGNVDKMVPNEVKIKLAEKIKQIKGESRQWKQ